MEIRITNIGVEQGRLIFQLVRQDGAITISDYNQVMQAKKSSKTRLIPFTCECVGNRINPNQTIQSYALKEVTTGAVVELEWDVLRRFIAIDRIVECTNLKVMDNGTVVPKACRR